MSRRLQNRGYHLLAVDPSQTKLFDSDVQYDLSSTNSFEQDVISDPFHSVRSFVRRNRNRTNANGYSNPNRQRIPVRTDYKVRLINARSFGLTKGEVRHHS